MKTIIVFLLAAGLLFCGVETRTDRSLRAGEIFCSSSEFESVKSTESGIATGSGYVSPFPTATNQFNLFQPDFHRKLFFLSGQQETIFDYSCDMFRKSEGFISTVTENRSAIEIIRGNAIDRSGLAIRPFTKRITGSFFGEWSSLSNNNSDASASGFDASDFGGSLGQDRSLSKYLLWGFAFHGTGLDLTGNNSLYRGSIHSVAGDLHLSVFGEQWYLDLQTGVGRNWNRYEIIGQKKNEYQSTQWNINFDFGLRIRQGFTRVDPFIGLHVSTLIEPNESGFYQTRTNKFLSQNESGNSYRFLLGSRFRWSHDFVLGTVFPNIYGFWVHEFGERDLFQTNELTEFPLLYRFGNNIIDRDRLNLGAGVNCALRDSFDLFFNYNSVLSGNFSSYFLSGGFNKKY